jgi:hypothetical protein
VITIRLHTKQRAIARFLRSSEHVNLGLEELNPDRLGKSYDSTDSKDRGWFGGSVLAVSLMGRVWFFPAWGGNLVRSSLLSGQRSPSARLLLSARRPSSAAARKLLCGESPRISPRAEDTLTARARTIANALDTLGANQGRFPANEAELAQVAAKLQGPDALVGPYYRDGTVAPVRLVYVGAASGPVLAEPDAPMPAAIYCAVSADRQRFWITVAMSDREVGGHPRWLRGTDGGTQPMVIRGSVRDGLPRMSKIGGVDSPQ